MASASRHLRRLAWMPKSIKQARIAPPPVYQGISRCVCWAWLQPPAAVVVMVRVAVPAVAPVMSTGLVEPKLRVGGSTAPLGLEVTAAVNVTSPVKPLAGVTVMVEVFPVVAPAVTVTAVPVIVKPAVPLVTVTEACPEAPA